MAATAQIAQLASEHQTVTLLLFADHMGFGRSEPRAGCAFDEDTS